MILPGTVIRYSGQGREMKFKFQFIGQSLKAPLKGEALMQCSTE